MASKPAEGMLPDSGSVSESVYTNDFFQFSYQFPKGWSVQEQTTKRYIMEMGKAIMSGGDPTRKAVLEVAEKHSYQLLAVFEHPFGAPVPFNPGIIVMAEDLSFAPGIQTAGDYLLRVKMALAPRHLELKILREPTDCLFGGKSFSRMDLSIETSTGTVVYESFVSTLLGRNALAFVFVGEKPERLDQLVPTLNTLEFKAQPDIAAKPPVTGSVRAAENAGRTSDAVEIITPTEGVNFDSYITRMMARIKQNWYTAMPEAAYAGEKGKTVTQFQIQPDGRIESAVIETSSGKVVLDEAALKGVRNSDPLNPLPSEFHGPYIRIRIIFLYNLPVSEAKPRPTN